MPSNPAFGGDPNTGTPVEVVGQMHQPRYERHFIQSEQVTLVFNRASLSERVEAALRQEITLGCLRPGQRISAPDYLANWNVSITPLRDAIRTFQSQRFVKVEPRKGVYVVPINGKPCRKSLSCG